VARYILTRAFYSLITLWLLVTIVFGMVRLTGDPVKMYGEVGADKAYLDELRRRWGLDKPLYRQYLSFMGGLVQGDFGYSFAKSLKVRHIYLDRLPNSLKLGFGAFIISLALGVPLGMLSAIKVNTSWDSVGLVLIIIFGVEFGWLPVMGKGEHWWDWQHLVMPAFALGWYFSGAMVQITRSSMLEVLGSDYIKLVRLKGMPEWVVMALHAFKNSMIPVLTLVGKWWDQIIMRITDAWLTLPSLVFAMIRTVRTHHNQST
jgi:peptide/nickel transport system permease protein